MESLIGPFIVLSAIAIILKIVKLDFKNKRNDRVRKESFITKFQDLTIAQMTFLSSLVLFIVIDFILVSNGYYIIVLKPFGVIVSIFLIVFVFFLMFWWLKIERYWVVSISIFVLPIVIYILFINAITSNLYVTIESPTGEETIIIEYRAATLGETHHIYNFYIETNSGVMKKVNPETVEIMTSKTNADSLEVLGIKNVEWVAREYVIFHSRFAQTVIKLKD